MRRVGFSSPKCARAAAFAAVACFAISVPFSAANAGFFDFLFAPLHPVQPAPQYAPQPQPHKKRVVIHRPKNLVAKLHPAKGPHAAPIVGLMDDESLRNGDVVMTADGIRTAFQNLRDGEQMRGLADAARCRSESDSPDARSRRARRPPARSSPTRAETRSATSAHRTQRL